MTALPIKTNPPQNRTTPSPAARFRPNRDASLGPYGLRHEKVSKSSSQTIDLNDCSCNNIHTIVTLLTRKLFIMLSQTPERLEVHVTEPGQRYELLDDAEATLRQVALAHRHAGIMVTRHDPSWYTFTLSDTVPFGETWEQTLA